MSFLSLPLINRTRTSRNSSVRERETSQSVSGWRRGGKNTVSFALSVLSLKVLECKCKRRARKEGRKEGRKGTSGEGDGSGLSLARSLSPTTFPRAASGGAESNFPRRRRGGKGYPSIKGRMKRTMQEGGRCKRKRPDSQTTRRGRCQWQIKVDGATAAGVSEAAWEN